MKHCIVCGVEIPDKLYCSSTCMDKIDDVGITHEEAEDRGHVDKPLNSDIADDPPCPVCKTVGCYGECTMYQE